LPAGLSNLQLRMLVHLLSFLLLLHDETLQTRLKTPILLEHLQPFHKMLQLPHHLHHHLRLKHLQPFHKPLFVLKQLPKHLLLKGLVLKQEQLRTLMVLLESSQLMLEISQKLTQKQTMSRSTTVMTTQRH